MTIPITTIGQKYTAPANGYIFMQGTPTVNGACGIDFRTSVQKRIMLRSNIINAGIMGFIPIKKEETCVFSWSAVENIQVFFVYAQGEIPTI